MHRLEKRIQLLEWWWLENRGAAPYIAVLLAFVVVMVLVHPGPGIF